MQKSTENDYCLTAFFEQIRRFQCNGGDDAGTVFEINSTCDGDFLRFGSALCAIGSDNVRI